MMDITNTDVFAMEGFMNSLELVDKMALLHNRLAHVNNEISKIQISLHNGGNIDSEQLKTVLNEFMREQGFINQRLKEFSIISRSAIDKILIEVFKAHDKNLFERLLAKAEKIYSERTKNKRT